MSSNNRNSGPMGRIVDKLKKTMSTEQVSCNEKKLLKHIGIYQVNKMKYCCKIIIV
jgi:RNase P/RNase MRP subunit p29